MLGQLRAVHDSFGQPCEDCVQLKFDMRNYDIFRFIKIYFRFYSLMFICFNQNYSIFYSKVFYCLSLISQSSSQDLESQNFGYLRKFERVFPVYVIDLKTDPRNVEVFFRSIYCIWIPEII